MMQFRTALFACFSTLALTMFAAGAAANVATKTAITLSLWEVCSSAVCDDVSLRCSSAGDFFKAGRAFCVLAAIFAGLCTFSGLFDVFFPKVLMKLQNAILGVFTVVLGFIAAGVCVAVLTVSMCGAPSFRDQEYSPGANIGLMFGGVCCAVLATAFECYGPEVAVLDSDAPDRDDAELSNLRHRRHLKSPPRSVVPSPRSRSAAVAAPAAPAVAAGPPALDGSWVLDMNSGLYYSQQENLWYDDNTGYFIDPATSMKYNPATGEWFE